jgi:hypothetical protein
MTHALQHPGTVQRTWIQLTDNPQFDIDRLVRALIDEAIRRDDEEFTDIVTGIKVHGVVRAYDLGVGRFDTIVSFARKANELTDWANSRTPALVDMLERRQFEDFVHDLAGLPRISMTLFDAQTRNAGMKEVGKDANYHEYDRAAAVVGEGVFTDHMGPCITVGLTALSADRSVRYNSILHSFGDDTGSGIMTKLHDRFDGHNGIPQYNTLTEVKYFVVGGAPEAHSRKKADELLHELLNRKVTVLGVALTTHDSYQGRSKAVVVTADGQVYWTIY